MPNTYHHVTAITGIVAAFAFVSFGVRVPVHSQSAPASVVDATGIDEFTREVAKYLTVHATLRAEVGDMSPASTAAHVSAASDTLAEAVRRARPKARRGDFFNAAVSRTITLRIGDAIRTGDLHAVLAQIDDERPTVGDPRVYLRFPSASPMATMPSSLLEVLPGLPYALEYRIIGEFLVLRDVHAALILDYIAHAVARE